MAAYPDLGGSNVRLRYKVNRYQSCMICVRRSELDEFVSLYSGIMY